MEHPNQPLSPFQDASTSSVFLIIKKTTKRITAIVLLLNEILDGKACTLISSYQVRNPTRRSLASCVFCNRSLPNFRFFYNSTFSKGGHSKLFFILPSANPLGSFYFANPQFPCMCQSVIRIWQVRKFLRYSMQSAKSKSANFSTLDREVQHLFV